MSQLSLAFALALPCTVLLSLFGRRPYVDEMRSAWRRGLASILFVGILAVAVFLPVASYGDVAALGFQDLTVVDLLAGHVLLAAFLVAWWLLRGDVSAAAFLHLSSHDLGDKIRLGIATGCGGWVATILVMMTAVSFAGAANVSVDASDVPDVMPWIAKLPLQSKLAIVLTAMTIEEAFFRGFLQPRVGLLPSSLMFALGHFSYGMPFMIVGVFTISLVIGRAFSRSRDLLPCMLAHGVFDAVQIFLVLPYAVRMLEEAVVPTP